MAGFLGFFFSPLDFSRQHEIFLPSILCRSKLFGWREGINSVVMLVLPKAAFSRQMQSPVVLVGGTLLINFFPRDTVPVLSKEAAIPADVV